MVYKSETSIVFKGNPLLPYDITTFQDLLNPPFVHPQDKKIIIWNPQKRRLENMSSFCDQRVQTNTLFFRVWAGNWKRVEPWPQTALNASRTVSNSNKPSSSYEVCRRNKESLRYLYISRRIHFPLRHVYVWKPCSLYNRLVFQFLPSIDKERLGQIE